MSLKEKTNIILQLLIPNPQDKDMKKSDIKN